MSVTCGVNSEAETPGHRMYVCHHCGMPVCELHGWIITADDAFNDGSGQRSHRTWDIAASLSRAAMHCPKCADDWHKGADRRHGPVNPRPQQPGPGPQPGGRMAGRT